MDRGLGEKSKKEAKIEKSSSQQEGLGGDPAKDVRSKGGDVVSVCLANARAIYFLQWSSSWFLGVTGHGLTRKVVSLPRVDSCIRFIVHTFIFIFVLGSALLRVLGCKANRDISASTGRMSWKQ